MWLEKINEIKKKSGKTIEEISFASSIPIGTLNKVFSGQTKDPKISTLAALVHSLGFTLDDLDDLSSAKSEQFSEDEYLITRSYKKLDLHGKKVVRSLIDLELERIGEKEIFNDNNVMLAKPQTPKSSYKPCIKEPQTFETTYFDDLSVSAGDGNYSTDLAHSIVVSLKKQPPLNTSYMVKVCGKSMEPTLLDGDKIFIQAQVDLSKGDIGIFVVDGSLYVKEYGEEKGLLSHNPEYPNIKVSKFSDFRCIGKYLGTCEEKIK